MMMNEIIGGISFPNIVVTWNCNGKVTLKQTLNLLSLSHMVSKVPLIINIVNFRFFIICSSHSHIYCPSLLYPIVHTQCHGYQNAA